MLSYKELEAKVFSSASEEEAYRLYYSVQNEIHRKEFAENLILNFVLHQEQFNCIPNGDDEFLVTKSDVPKVEAKRLVACAISAGCSIQELDSIPDETRWDTVLDNYFARDGQYLGFGRFAAVKRNGYLSLAIYVERPELPPENLPHYDAILDDSLKRWPHGMNIIPKEL